MDSWSAKYSRSRSWIGSIFAITLSATISLNSLVSTPFSCGGTSPSGFSLPPDKSSETPLYICKRLLIPGLSTGSNHIPL
ncbi:hypothetical protein AX774_g5161 [Zancudomyces culisetae]|uniref:Uncharacterized protein n=1 Tax=Zancudomyces culisetae TaxID=1213189 RepID=A0A1R1PK81_ZANCU|nr:hypothetical protein AX774_g5161 [Zancudomyces culisetae]|eukprot:OMH81378.1 hypothetical protein AX774_g5161 [Zancudomyces culisetae]